MVQDWAKIHPRPEPGRKTFDKLNRLGYYAASRKGVPPPEKDFRPFLFHQDAS